MLELTFSFLLRRSDDGALYASIAIGWIALICQPYRSRLTNASEVPHVTAIRPVKGLEPHLYDCLAATFRQDYPSHKLSICLCVSTRDDPAYPALCKLITDFPHVDARIYLEDEDPLLQQNGINTYTLGPNPKIRNMSRAYREAKGDIVWIIDSNVWVGKGVCARMVDRLCGTGPSSSKKYKFVHHLPVAVDLTGERTLIEERQALVDANPESTNVDTAAAAMPSVRPEDGPAAMIATGGGRLEELFLSSSHAKMYTAINTVLVAPCIVGKSNMFRRSHLDYLTSLCASDPQARHPGIDFFSVNICEDHLIGDLLWKKQVREEKEFRERWGKHAMVFGDMAIQPVANMSVSAYIARRVRWLRVRKFTVLLATLVEPGTESFLCTTYGAWGITSALAPCLERSGVQFAAHLGTWGAFFILFALGMAFWILVDWKLYIKLHSAKCIELDDDTPAFARPQRYRSSQTTRRPFMQWFGAWLGRELLALPIWIMAVYGGVTVVWRDRRFKVGFDAKVREIDPPTPPPLETSSSTGAVVGKVRSD
ncbi:Ceramide glucosyltransferase, putative [Penicillium digitatum PHI26]|uniref:Ceramide glucosyltransferase n=2 Tax=Penicillium digitatum TaxID=36651 RepID=K9FX09_PEND2|nr:Ceramide glucosyltransferase, putative [Penicillium digitatum Pd1]EKV12123.1 Ceramide glucosyltransferase, putative [Penicillium digitatum Pd1]EKV14210.1 Ceramide glucosyltransferase, putative [Penicillium digitatum PHI26]